MLKRLRDGRDIVSQRFSQGILIAGDLVDCGHQVKAGLVRGCRMLQPQCWSYNRPETCEDSFAPLKVLTKMRRNPWQSSVDLCSQSAVIFLRQLLILSRDVWR